MSEQKRLYRSRTDRMIGGVCGGLGKFLDIDPTIIRVVVAIITFPFPATILAYFVMLLVVPEEPLDVPPSSPLPPAQ
ncbi:PspC domain-containing protein [Longilinea arvoryzae]|nr:PspC domain-containing protein [Longilinea arvoryzae]